MPYQPRKGASENAGERQASGSGTSASTQGPHLIALVIGRFPLLAAALPSGLLALLALALQLPADPAPGVTFSESPWTDEGWSVLGARNLVLLGTWSSDDLSVYLMQLPFNVTVAGAFELFDVGILQARAVSLVMSVGAVTVTSLLVARAFGPLAGAVAGIALATSPLLLYYGRLAYLEPMVTISLVLGVSALLSARRSSWVLGALAGGCLALAIGTKPSAIASAVGILGGAALAGGTGVPRVRRRVLIAATVIIIAGAGWVLLIALPQREAVETGFRFWPSQPLPEQPWDWVVRVGRYIRASDGANTLTLPLYLAAATGLWLSVRGWTALDGRQRVAVGMAVGWVAVGLLLIVVTAYRPNRYVVPLLPGLAILAGAGVAVAVRRWPATAWVRRAALITVVFLLAAPGAVLWGRWMTTATHRLPGIQAEVAEIVGDSGAVEGGAAPTIAMRAPVPLIVSRPGLDINAGDNYAEYGVRWLVADDTYVPAWAELHPDAWNGRIAVGCYFWGEDLNPCLIRVP